MRGDYGEQNTSQVNTPKTFMHSWWDWIALLYNRLMKGHCGEQNTSQVINITL